jgi:hypothetical protein
MRAGEPRRWSGTGRALGGVPSRARRALKCSYGDGLKRPLRTAMSGRSAGSKPFERRRAAHDRVRMQAATALRRRPTRTALEEAVKTREGVYVCVYAKSSRCSRCAASRVCAELRLQSNSVRPTDCQTWFDWFWLGKGQMPIFGVREAAFREETVTRRQGGRQPG